MVSNRAAHSGTGHPVMTRQVTDDATHHGTLDAPMGAGGDRQRPSRER
jgi:hypothetical protein